MFSDYTFRTVLFGTAAIGAVSGALGCFAYLRRQSLIGDVVSHASLFGIMLFFLASYWITGEGNKSLFVLIPGAITSGIAALLLANWTMGFARVREDSGLGVMLAIFFGTGVLLLRWVQHANPGIPGRAGLQDFLFGMAASMTRSDLVMISILGTVSILTMLMLWKELKVFTFDPLFAHSIGYRTKVLDVLLIALLVMGVVIGIQCVGVILMIALLVTPAAAARQWTRSLEAMVALAAVIGAISAAIGSVVSAQVAHIPTGPVIVLAGCLIFTLSVIFAPRRGLLARAIRHKSIIAEQTSAQREGTA